MSRLSSREILRASSERARALVVMQAFARSTTNGNDDTQPDLSALFDALPLQIVLQILQQAGLPHLRRRLLRRPLYEALVDHLWRCFPRMRALLPHLAALVAAGTLSARRARTRQLMALTHMLQDLHLTAEFERGALWQPRPRFFFRWGGMRSGESFYVYTTMSCRSMRIPRYRHVTMHGALGRSLILDVRLDFYGAEEVDVFAYDAAERRVTATIAPNVSAQQASAALLENGVFSVVKSRDPNDDWFVEMGLNATMIDDAFVSYMGPILQRYIDSMYHY